MNRREVVKRMVGAGLALATVELIVPEPRVWALGGLPDQAQTMADGVDALWRELTWAARNDPRYNAGFNAYMESFTKTFTGIEYDGIWIPMGETAQVAGGRYVTPRDLGSGKLQITVTHPADEATTWDAVGVLVR